MIVLELLLKGDLRRFLLDSKKTQNDTTSLDDHTLLSFCHQVASGMMYLSGKGFIHRDLAARNVLITDENRCKVSPLTLEEKSSQVLIIDLGRKSKCWSVTLAVAKINFSLFSGTF